MKEKITCTLIDNFVTIIPKAKTDREISGESIDNHFADVGKMASIDSGA